MLKLICRWKQDIQGQQGSGTLFFHSGSCKRTAFLVLQCIFWLCTTVHANRTVNFTIKWIWIEECLVSLLNRTILLGVQDCKNPPVNQHFIMLLSISITLHPGRGSIRSAFKLLCTAMSCVKKRKKKKRGVEILLFHLSAKENWFRVMHS